MSFLQKIGQFFKKKEQEEVYVKDELDEIEELLNATDPETGARLFSFGDRTKIEEVLAQYDFDYIRLDEDGAIVIDDGGGELFIEDHDGELIIVDEAYKRRG